MKCIHCQSENTQSKILKKDKGSRRMLAFVIAFLLVMIPMTIMGIITYTTLLSIFVGFVFAIVIGVLAVIVASVIPAKNIVVFVCNDCGKITKT